MAPRKKVGPPDELTIEQPPEQPVIANAALALPLPSLNVAPARVERPAARPSSKGGGKSSGGKRVVNMGFSVVSVCLMYATYACKLAAPVPATPDTADTFFTHAKAEAKMEHKNVLMVFSASWCGPCKHFEQFLEDPQMKSITEKAFVIQRIAVGEEYRKPNTHTNTPGGARLRSALGAVDEPGFPFLVMTDENGKPLINSYRNGKADDNIGMPEEPTEIDWYLMMLKRAAPSLSPEDLVATRTWLQKHAH